MRRVRAFAFTLAVALTAANLPLPGVSSVGLAQGAPVDPIITGCQAVVDSGRTGGKLKLDQGGLETFAGSFMCQGLILGLRAGVLRGADNSWGCLSDTVPDATIAAQIVKLVTPHSGRDRKTMMQAISQGLAAAYPCQ